MTGFVRDWVANPRSPTTKPTRPWGGVPTVARHEPIRQSRALEAHARRRTDRARGGLRRRGTGRVLSPDQPGRALPGHREGRAHGPDRGDRRPCRSARRRQPVGDLAVDARTPRSRAIGGLPDLRRRTRAHDRPLGRAGATVFMGAAGRTDPGIYPQRAALYDAGRPVTRPLGLPPGLAARTPRPAVLHAPGHPGPVRPVRLADLRYRVEISARRRVRPVPAGYGADRPDAGDRRGDVRRPDPADRVPGPIRPCGGRSAAYADLVVPRLGDQQPCPQRRAGGVPRHDPGRPRYEQHVNPVRGPGQDLAGRAEDPPPAAGDHPPRRPPPAATGAPGERLSHRRRARRRSGPFRRTGAHRLPGLAPAIASRR